MTVATSITSITTDKTEYQPESDLPIALTPPVGRRYYWRVRACSQGACSEYSRTRWINVARTKCDFNADGYDDVAISAYAVSGSANAIYFYYGSADSTFGMMDSGVVFSPFGDGGGFGISISCAGDVDGDGYADVVAGAPYAGDVFVFRGNGGARFTGSYIELKQYAGNGAVGTHVASAGDVNGDGFGDIIVGSGNSATPSAYLYLGGSAGPKDSIALDLGEVDPQTDVRVASAGDVNGDGFSDVMISFPESELNVVWVYYGNSGQGFNSTAKVELIGPLGDVTFGDSLASVGDVNGDGFGDVLIGATGTDHAYLYLGGPQGLDSVSIGTLPGYRGSGAVVAAIGDINGDGFDDMAITGEVADGGGFAGVLVYLGDDELKLDGPNVAILRDARELRIGQRLGSPGDINGDGYSDFTIANGESDIVFMYLGGAALRSPAIENATMSQAAGVRDFGFAVAHR